MQAIQQKPIIAENMHRYIVDGIHILLEDVGPSQGRIIISDTGSNNYSFYWGSMGGTIKEFICRINSDYFADKLLGARSLYEMDVKATFAEIKRHIRTEMGLPWYKYMEFQKDMRECLNDFKEHCEENNSQQCFVDNFDRLFVDRLSFYLIPDRFDREYHEKEFKNIHEPWNFIQEKENAKCLWLKKLHKNLKKHLVKQDKKQSKNK